MVKSSAEGSSRFLESNKSTDERSPEVRQTRLSEPMVVSAHPLKVRSKFHSTAALI